MVSLDRTLHVVPRFGESNNPSLYALATIMARDGLMVVTPNPLHLTVPSVC